MIWFFLIGCLTLITLVNVAIPRCRHVWQTIKEHDIICKSRYDGKDLPQTEALLSCKCCGELIRINLTTGVKEVVSRGGTPSNDTINIK